GVRHGGGRTGVVEVAEQDEDRVGTRAPGLQQLELFGEETLGEERHRSRGACGLEIVERAAEALIDENRDGCGARVRELRGESGRVGVGTEVPGGGRAAFDLRNRDQAWGGEGSAESAHHAATLSREKATSSSRRSPAAPESIVRRATSRPSRRSAARPLAAIAPAALSRIASRRPPFFPANTSRIASAFSAGLPPRSSSTLQRGIPSSASGSSRRSSTWPSTTSATRFGPTAESSSMPPPPWTAYARLVPSRASTSAIVRTSSGE